MYFYIPLQAIYRWMNRVESGVGGEDKKMARQEVITIITKLKNQTSVSCIRSISLYLRFRNS